MKTVEVTSLKLGTILKLVILHLEQTIAQEKYKLPRAQTFSSVKWRNLGNSFCLFQKAEILDMLTLGCVLPETNRLLKDLFD